MRAHEKRTRPCGDGAERQSLIDALKRIRAGEQVWFSWRGERLLLAAPTNADNGTALFLTRNEGAVVSDYSSKDCGDGSWATQINTRGGRPIFRGRRILAEVLERVQ